MSSRSLRRFTVFILLLAAINPVRSEQPFLHSHREFKIGVLVSLTGSWNSLGQNTVAALQLANEQLQATAKAEHGGYRFHLFVRDTQLDPTKALAAIQDLDKRGVKIVIGPQSSAEVAMIKPYADAHNILVISQGSTASSLAISGDNIFRFCPNDMREAEAIVALMWHDGIRTIVPLWRDDAGNNGLHDSVKADFEKLGGTVTTGYQYQPATTDFSAATTSVTSQITDFASFKAAFVNTANAYSGITGSTALDSAGDRLNADFDFWAVRLTNGNYGWARIGAYTNGTLTLF